MCSYSSRPRTERDQFVFGCFCFIDPRLRIVVTFHVRTRSLIKHAVRRFEGQGKFFFANLEEEKKSISLCLVALPCDQLLPIREWRCQYIDQVLLHRRCFLTSASSSTEIPGLNVFICLWNYSSNCWISRKKRGQYRFLRS